MIPLYMQRIHELENEIDELDKQVSDGQLDVWALEILQGRRRAHIEKYQKFIKKASEIIREHERTVGG